MDLQKHCRGYLCLLFSKLDQGREDADLRATSSFCVLRMALLMISKHPRPSSFPHWMRSSLRDRTQASSLMSRASQRSAE